MARVIQVLDVDGNHQGSCIVNDDDGATIRKLLLDADTQGQFVIKHIIPDTAEELLAEVKRADEEATTFED